jgi:hypothetical protein
MKLNIVLIFLLCVLYAVAQKEPPRQKAPAGTLKVELDLNTWNAVFNELQYAKERAMESNLTEAQKSRIDSSMTQITRMFYTQVASQVNALAVPNKDSANKKP